ncbi:MAG TPA: hypothetical protein VIF84_01930 [Candidatus Limnocylindrales bacterium]
MAMVRTNVTLPEAMLREIDEIAGPRGRSAYVAGAVDRRLKRDRMRKIFDETYGAAQGHSQWKDADEVYRWVRSLREDTTRDDRVWGKRSDP